MIILIEFNYLCGSFQLFFCVFFKKMEMLLIIKKTTIKKSAHFSFINFFKNNIIRTAVITVKNNKIKINPNLVKI